MPVSYVFSEGQEVIIIATNESAYVTSRVPGNGTGSGFYYVQVFQGLEKGPLLESELRAA